MKRMEEVCVEKGGVGKEDVGMEVKEIGDVVVSCWKELLLEGYRKKKGRGGLMVIEGIRKKRSGVGMIMNEVGEKEMEKEMEVGVVNVGKVGMGGEE